MTETDRLRILFTARGISGQIAVSVTPNTDPDAIGYSLLSGGLPTDVARGYGTTTAWNPDRTKVRHSHGPARAG